MTREELVAWAARHGLTVVPTVRYNALCAQIAAIEADEIDADLLALIGGR